MREDKDGIIMGDYEGGIPKNDYDLWIEKEKYKILKTFTPKESQWIFNHAYKNKFKKENTLTNLETKKTYDYLELKYLFKHFEMDEKDLDWAIGRYDKWG